MPDIDPAMPALLLAFVRANVGDEVAIEPVAGAHEDADVWRVDAGGARYYLKRPHHAGLVPREHSAYRALAPHLGDAIPRLVAVADAPIGALLLGEAVGAPYDEAALETAEEIEIHRQLGKLRRRFDSAGVTHDPVDPAEAVARRMRHWLVRGETLDDAIRERVRVAFDPRPLRGMARAWCHRDLGTHNVRIEIDHDRATHYVRIVDFGRARPDVWLVDLLDLAADRWHGRPELVTAFFAGYGRDPSPREREGLRALALVHAVATAVWGDRHGDATRSLRGRVQIERWLDEGRGP